jgi:hypothetical protein
MARAELIPDFMRKSIPSDSYKNGDPLPDRRS